MRFRGARAGRRRGVQSPAAGLRFGPTGERLGLGERLLAARKRRRLTQLEAAREIGVCRETVARIEIEHIPSAATREKVLRWLEAQEAAFAAEGAAAAVAAERRRLERLARARERRHAIQRLGCERLRGRGRLTLRRRTARVIRAAEKQAGKRR